MKFTLTLLESHLDELRSLTFSLPGCEGAAFILCSRSETEEEHRLIAHTIVPVADADYLERRPDFLSLASDCYVRAAKEARSGGFSVVFVHSHPGGFLEYSDQDDREEPKLQQFLASRVPEPTHGSLVLTTDGIIGRVWKQGAFAQIDRIRVIGRRFAFHDRTRKRSVMEFFDRQVRAFGGDVQSILQSLHIGVVGAGGTGSAVAEQLIRLGVGRISVFDGDNLDTTNINRVFGSGSKDGGKHKVGLVGANSKRIGVGTRIHEYPEHISHLATALHLRDCDVVFGCTDLEAPRGLLVSLALRYYIPVFDMGVKIDSEDEKIRDVVGRVTLLLPGEACLFCRGRISAEGILYEGMSPEERENRAKEGYAPELGSPNPAVITFTSMVASLAINELLHRLTGFMGEEKESSEVLCFFDKLVFRRNRPQPGPDCLCGLKKRWGKGDSRLFLDVVWSR